MKRITAILAASLMILAMSSTAFAAGISENEALAKALKNAKLSEKQVSVLKTEYDHEDGVYEVEFIKAKGGTEYDYEISAYDGKILERKTEYTYKWNSSKKKIGKKAAQKKAAKKAGVKLSTVQKGSCHYEYDDGMGTYEIKFRSGGRIYDVDILAPTGKVIEYGWELIGR